MRSLDHCVQSGVQPVQQPHKTVFGLCNFIVHYPYSSKTVSTTHRLPAWLSATCALLFPPSVTAFNRACRGFIPTVHSPNNKSCMDTLRINIEKLWIGDYAI